MKAEGSPWRILMVIYLVSVAAKAGGALLISQPGYMDAYYYYHVAANLASGRGFVEDFLWNYLDDPAGIPHPSNLYWMPLTSVLMAPTLWLLGASFRAAQVALVLLSSVLPLIAFFVARHFLALRQQVVAVVTLSVFSGVYFIYWAVPDGLASFGVTGALALWLMALAMEGDPRLFLLAAAFTGLAQLARPDGLLLLAVLLLACCLRFWAVSPASVMGVDPSIGPRQRTSRFFGWLAVSLSIVAVHLLVLAPWMYRNWQTLGVLWPGASEALFQREYNDIFRYGRSLDWRYYLDWGWQNILMSKLEAAGKNVIVFAGPFLVYMLPLGLIGFWQMRRRPSAWPFLIYAALLYLSMTLLFTFAGPRGSYLHSAVALLPFYYSAIVKGLEGAVAWTARRLRHWVEPRAQRNFLIIFVGIAVIMSGVLSVRAAGTWDERYRAYNHLAQWFADNAPAGAIPMVVDPPAWHYSSGRSAIVFVNEDLETTVRVCWRYGARYLFLEVAHPHSLHSFYLGQESHPALVLRATVDEIRVFEVLPPTAYGQ